MPQWVRSIPHNSGGFLSLTFKEMNNNMLKVRTVNFQIIGRGDVSSCTVKARQSTWEVSGTDTGEIWESLLLSWMKYLLSAWGKKGLLPTVSGGKSHNPAQQVEWGKQVVPINQLDIRIGRNYWQQYVAYSSLLLVCSVSVFGIQTETNMKKHGVVLPPGILMGFPRRTGAEGLQTIWVSGLYI